MTTPPLTHPPPGPPATEAAGAERASPGTAREDPASALGSTGTPPTGQPASGVSAVLPELGPGLSIDTVGVLSPLLSTELLGAIRPKLDLMSLVNPETGDVRWEVSKGTLETAALSTISLRIRNSPDGARLSVEGSVHKLVLGHNILGNADGFQPRVRELLATASAKLGITLPAAELWSVRRVDVALVFDLGSASQVEQFFRGMRGCVYPRRKVHQYGLESIYAPGKVASVKMYHKGPEFRRNGADFRKQLSAEGTAFLQQEADKRLRVEVELRARRLARISAARKSERAPPVSDVMEKAEVDARRVARTVAGPEARRQPLVSDVTDAALERMFEAELDVLLRERRSGLAIVRRQEDVHARLREQFKRGKADSLLGFWNLLATQGEDAIRSKFPRSTFYRQRTELAGAGITWHGTDTPDAAGTPEPLEGLTISRSDPRRCAETIEEARALLAAASRRKPEGD